MAKKPTPIELDILHEELVQKTPHWLSPVEKDYDKRRKFFDKKREKWLKQRDREKP